MPVSGPLGATPKIQHVSHMSQVTIYILIMRGIVAQQKLMSEIIDKVISLRIKHDPWWSKELQKDETYPSVPPTMPLKEIAPTGIEMSAFKWSDLPLRYHWYIWLEHAGEQMYYVYDDAPDGLLEDPDTTVDQVVNACNYAPTDYPPLFTDHPDTFEEFLDDSIKPEYRVHLPFLPKYGLLTEDDCPHDFHVAYKFVDKALSLVQNKKLMEQDLYHIFCILSDTISLRNKCCFGKSLPL